jgi:hypothetical protein
MSLATAPQFFDRCVKKDHRLPRRAKEINVCRHTKCSTAKGNNAVRLSFLQYLPQGGSLDSAKRSFAFVGKNLVNGASFFLDAMVQIHELPIQPLSQGAADFRLAGAHEAR